MPSQIAQGTGTAIGSLTSSGGLAAAFDGTTSQAASVCATTAPSVSGYNNTVGKDWGVGVTKTIVQFSIWGPNNSGIINTVDTTIKLQGSNDNSVWTDLYTSATLTGSGSANYTTTVTRSSITTTTAYRYHRINVNGNGTNQASVAEVIFYEDFAPLSATAGTYALTGVAAGLGKNFAALLATAGSYALTGVTAAQAISRVATVGSYALTGNATAQKISRLSFAGAYVLTGNAVAQKIVMLAESGAYTLTGIVLEVVRIVAPASKFALRLEKYRLQKLRASDPTLQD